MARTYTNIIAALDFSLEPFCKRLRRKTMTYKPISLGVGSFVVREALGNMWGVRGVSQNWTGDHEAVVWSPTEP